MKNRSQNRKLYWYITCRFLLIFAILLLTQLFFFLCNTRIFHIDGFREVCSIMWGNIRFGLAGTALFLAPYLIMLLLPFDARWSKGYRIVAEILFWGGALTLIIVNLVDVAYYQFTYRRMNAMMFRYMGVGGDMGNLIPRFIVDYWYVTLAAIVLVTGMVLTALQMRMRIATFFDVHQNGPHIDAGNTRRFHSILGSLTGIAILVILLRGGFERHWIMPGEVVRYAQPKNSALVMNSAYNIARTIGHLDAKDEKFMSPARAATLYNPEYENIGGCLFPENQPASMTNNVIQQDGATRSRNVVFLILESFSQEYMGCYNNGALPSYTPFLDKLSTRCTCYQGRSNGKESIESIPAILASLPSWSYSPFILSPYYNDTIHALPYILKSHGYQTAFFHGSYNGSMNFDKFCKKAGINFYYGKNEYIAAHGNAAYDGAWGIFDEPFLQYTLEEMNKMNQPFFAATFTISSHHPYSVPEQYEGKFPTGEHPLLQTVAYVDFALQRFFEEASKQPWYFNTLFVIMGDHPGQALTRGYNDYHGWYSIPMMFYTPGDTAAATFSDDIVQQIDVMPTVLDILGLSDHAICFGQSALRYNGDNHGWQVAFGNDYYQLERNGRIALYSPYKTQGTREDLEFLKAVIQTYNSRLINNLLVSKK